MLDLMIAAFIGLVAGVIINMLADDLPLRRAVRTPRYVPDSKKRAVHVPVLDDDGNDVSWNFVHEDDERRPLVAWLGLTAFLFGKRESSDGTVRLNWRYPLTELLTVLLMILTLLAVDAINADPGVDASVTPVQTIIWFFYMAVFVLIIVIDIEHKLILFVVVLPTTAIALIDAVLTSYPPTFVDALAGGVFGFVVFFVLYNGGFIFTYIMGIIRGQPITEVALGYGDVMMVMLSGTILGWRVLIFALFITVFLGAFGALAYLLSRALAGSRYNAFTALPYGPYIVIGTLLMLLYGHSLGPAMFGAVFP